MIRKAVPADLKAVLQIFSDTIYASCRGDYTPDQLDAWSSSASDLHRWEQKIIDQYFLIAEIGGNPVGFASLDGKNELDLLYVHKDFQRTGIANLLYGAIEAQAYKNEASELNSDVSISAKSFFERKGFRVVTSQEVTINNISIRNFRMIKVLKPDYPI